MDKLWRKSYSLGPYKLDQTLAPLPEVPLFQFLYQTAEKYPAQTAILFEGRKLTYQELRQQADRLACALASLGVEKGDRVCLSLPNCPEFIIGYWAVMKAGGVVVPTSILRSEEGLLHEVSTSQSKVILCQEHQLERCLGLMEKSTLDVVIVTSNQGYDVSEVTGPLADNVFELRRLLAEHPASPPSIEIHPTQDLCELAFTGGATGVPKGVMLTHFNRTCSVLQGLPWIMKPMLRPIIGKASVLLAIPLFHAFGNYVHLTAVYLAMRLLLLPDPRKTEQIVQCVRDHRPFLIPGVPTQFMRMTDAGLTRLNALLLSGSAPLPAEVADRIRRKTGMPISEGYGLTETSAISHFNLSAFSKITGFAAQIQHGIGVPCPETDCRLVDPDSGEEVPSGKPGELLLRGPQVMQGYWPEPGSGLTQEGWLHTGDIAVMDERGYFQIVDRIKDMVNVSGLKVYTTEVDEVLFQHPAVHMAAAFSIPDPETPGSERVAAVVQAKQDVQTPSAEEIMLFCRKHLPPYAVPSRIEFREDLPLTVSEKVFKKKIREQMLQRLASDNVLGSDEY